MRIYCCGCNQVVMARLTNGAEIYPHRNDLRPLPFWRCDGCNNYVGCHHKTDDRTRPLGIIPTKEIRDVRQSIHRVLDPLWKSGRKNRKSLYAEISKKMGCKEYHTANIRTVEEANKVLSIVQEMSA